MFVANPLDRFELVSLARTAAYRRTRLAINDWEQLFRPGVEAFEVLVAVLDEFARQVRSDGATPIIVMLPSQTEITIQANGGKTPTAPLAEALRQRGLTTIDMTEPLGTVARRSAASDLIAGHYKALGNDVVAHTLATQLPALIAPTCAKSS